MSRDTRSYYFDDSYLREGGELKITGSPSMPGVVAETASTSSSASSGRSPVKAPVLYRTNFGKNMTYIPPANGVWHGYSPPSKPVRKPATMVVDDDDEDEPFDQKRDSQQPYVPSLAAAAVRPRPSSPSSMSRPFDEAGEEDGDEFESTYHHASNSNKSPSRSEYTARRGSPWDAPVPRSPAMAAVTRNYYSDQETASSRYRMAAPRISDPVLFPYHTKPDSLLSASSGLGAMSSALDDSLQGHASSSPGPPSVGGVVDEIDLREQAPRTNEEEDDSLFDFEENERRRQRAKRYRKTRRSRSKEEDVHDYDDEASLEIQPSLTERAAVAWQRKSARARARSLSPRNVGDTPAVSFGNNDTVHEFEPDPDETLESTTLGGRSLNSEYTKSAESEVEDLIKDIFMIGSGKASNPGRRKLKYSPHVKAKLRAKGGDATDDDDETLETYEDELPPRMDSTRKHEHLERESYLDDSLPDEKKDEDEGDPLTTVWKAMEGGFSALGSAFGLDDKSLVEECVSKSNSKKSRKSRSLSAPCGNFSDSNEKGQEGRWNMLRYATDIFLGQSHSSCEGDTADDLVKKAPSLEEDLRLIELAVQAARSMHKLRGFEYDEANDLNIVTDIKFCVVDLSLPLGLIFQENETGCWITKVLPGGNAAASGMVQVGDQLAAVDGVSAINMKVDEIAAVIKKKSSDIELTFLRYVGPLAPAAGTIAEEGYEVKAAEKATLIDGAPERRRCGHNVLSGKKHQQGSTQPVPNGAATAQKTSARNLQTQPANSRRTNNTTAAQPSEKKKFRLFGKRK